MTSTAQKPNLCDYCHQKPKFGNYNYCGKTCSQQATGISQTNTAARTQPQTASTLCKQCNQKPKFQNFDFCGKNCASNWQLINGGSKGNPNPAAKNLPGGNLLGKVTANMQVPTQLLGNLPQPLQSQLQAVLPAVVASLQQQGQGQNPPQQPQPSPSVNLNVNNVIPSPPSNVPQRSTAAITNANANPPQQNSTGQNASGPGLPAPQVSQVPANGIKNAAIPAPAPGQAQPAVPTTCRLTGCSKPVYADPTSNHPSEYCSKRHREEAVITGQVTACIMCLKMPRSATDHFCSKACRDAALSQ